MEEMIVVAGFDSVRNQSSVYRSKSMYLSSYIGPIGFNDGKSVSDRGFLLSSPFSGEAKSAFDVREVPLWEGVVFLAGFDDEHGLRRR